jgi:hypothetical protein
MSLTKEDKLWHKEYESLDEETIEAINDAFDSVVFDLRIGVGITGAMDDRAEALIAAIARYAIESKNARPVHKDCPGEGCDVCQSDWPCAKLVR